MLILSFSLALLGLLFGVSALHDEHHEAEGLSSSEYPIVDHIEQVQGKTVQLASLIEKWDGDLISAIGITAASQAVLTAIGDGTKTAKDLRKEMSVQQAVKVKEATEQLLEKITASLGTITGSKARFDHAGITSLMLPRIKKTKEAAEALIAAVVEKLPAGQDTGRRLGRLISAEFDKAIAAFSER